MNTRRKFLLQGSMATSAMLVAKPFQSIANGLSPLTGFSVNDSKVVILHTANGSNNKMEQTMEQINFLKKNTGNLMLLHAGNLANCPFPKMKYDITLPEEHRQVIGIDDHRIINKGNIRIGIVYAAKGEKNVVKRLNELGTRLKKSNNCQLVICISQLGFNNNAEMDDLKLAAASTNLDLILGGDPLNSCSRPSILKNIDKCEVIINSHTGKTVDFGNIVLGFDDKGNKNFFAINNLRKRSDRIS